MTKSSAKAETNPRALLDTMAEARAKAAEALAAVGDAELIAVAVALAENPLLTRTALDLTELAKAIADETARAQIAQAAAMLAAAGQAIARLKLAQARPTSSPADVVI